MARFICKNCDYRFESESEQIRNKCPYCGKPEIMKEPSAEDLIED